MLCYVDFVFMEEFDILLNPLEKPPIHSTSSMDITETLLSRARIGGPEEADISFDHISFMRH